MPLLKRNLDTVEKEPTPTPVGRTQTLALTAFIISFFESIIPIVLGHVALRNYKNEKDQTWKNFATAGLILGYVGLIIRIKIAALITLILIAGGATYSKTAPYHMETNEKHSYYMEKMENKNSTMWEKQQERKMGKKYDR